ncbi:MAG: hypothetical protein ACFFG0_15425 [Candidatus Thorarchaeota archaeon]
MTEKDEWKKEDISKGMIEWLEFMVHSGAVEQTIENVKKLFDRIAELKEFTEHLEVLIGQLYEGTTPKTAILESVLKKLDHKFTKMIDDIICNQDLFFNHLKESHGYGIEEIEELSSGEKERVQNNNK